MNVTGFLRFVGLLNAAVWCGSSIFLIVGLPAVFSPELKHLLTPAGVGFAAESILGRYFILQYCCGGIALLHLLVEWLYYGRSPWRLNFGLLTVVITFGLIGGLWVQPKMRALHIVKYFGKSAQQQAQAAKTFASWHALSETANLVVIGCLIWYLWRISKEREPQHFVNFSKMKG